MDEERIRLILKLEIGIFGGIVSLLLGGLYLESCRDTGETRPWKQREANLEYDKLSKKVFEQLADTNKDRALSFEENVGAYRRMGYTNYFRYDSEFPNPTKQKLERAVKSYKEGR